MIDSKLKWLFEVCELIPYMDSTVTGVNDSTEYWQRPGLTLNNEVNCYHSVIVIWQAAWFCTAIVAIVENDDNIIDMFIL